MKRDELIEKVTDKLQTVYNAGFNNEALNKIKANEIIDLCQPQWVRVEDRLPDEDEVVIWWLVAKPPEECMYDTSGNPIAPNCKPYMYECKFNCWSSVMKPSHWIRKPQPPIE